MLESLKQRPDPKSETVKKAIKDSAPYVIKPNEEAHAKSNNLLVPGDVFKVKKFKDLVYSSEDKDELRIDSHYDSTSRDRGTPNLKVKKQERESLEGAKWLVTQAHLGGGGTAMFNDRYADGWRVHALRLNKEGKVDAKSESLYFTQTGAFSTTIESKISKKKARPELLSTIVRDKDLCKRIYGK